MRPHSIPLLFLVSLFLAMTARAATPSTPEALVKEYSLALQTEGMKSVSRFMHSEELARFKQALLPMLRKDAAGKNEAIPALFGPKADLASIEAMSPARFMDGIMNLVGDKMKGASFGEAEVIGSVKEKDVVHVVTRLAVQVEKIDVKSLTVMSARLDGQQWKLLMTGEIEGLMAALSAAE